jgi:hypothetical protein
MKCEHANTVIRAKKTAAGLVARSQCKDCGHHGKGGGQAIGKAELIRRGVRNIADLPPYDEAAFQRALERASREGRREYWARKLDVLIEEPQSEIAANDPYYSSEKWARLRALVIRRAGGRCEGCGEAEATQAHHLHYRTFGNEFLWDLRAVCRDCHERVHGIQKKTEEEVVNQVRKYAEEEESP